MEILRGLLHTSIVGSVGIVGFSLVLLFCRGKCSAKGRKAGWILLAICLLLPLHVMKFRGAYTVEIQDVVIREQYPVYVNQDTMYNVSIAESVTYRENNFIHEITTSDVLLFLWFFITVLLGMYNLSGYWTMYRKNLRWSVESQNENITKIMQKIAKEMRMKKLPYVRISVRDDNGPFTMGVIKKNIFLPQVIDCDKDLEYILKHEMTHCKENDNFWKLLFLGVNTIHWFNPFVWMMRKFANQDIEVACDETVLKHASAEERREYSKVIMLWIEKNRNGSQDKAFSTSYASEKRFLKKRFMSIFDYRTKWSGKLLVGSIAIVLLLISGMVAIQISNKTVSGQNVPIDNLGEIEGNGNRDNTMIETTHEMSAIEDYEERGSDESIQSSETEEDYYMMSTSLKAEEVEQFAAEIKNDILKYNWDALAEKISYPIVISGITVNNREDFLKLDIDGNLNQEFVEAIGAETCRKMFCNWQGVRMGAAGQIWFGNVDNGKGASELLIIGINDMLEAQMSSIAKTIREDKTTITFMIEGIPEEVSATLYEGSNYSIYIPNEGWKMYASESWISNVNEEVRFWIVDYASETVDVVIEQLVKDGYNLEAREVLTQYDEDNAVVQNVQVVADGDAVRAIFYCYPVDAEEGWGSKLATIISTFSWINQG